jgi:hypothetical protein
MLTCGLVRSNFAFATGVLLWTSWFVAAAACGATWMATGYSPVAFAMISFATFVGTSA